MPPPQMVPHPYDFLFDWDSGDVRIDGPITEEQAGAQAWLSQETPSKIRRYLEVEFELKKKPGNSALRKELAELKPYWDFLEYQGRRRIRHEALRRGREALKDPASKSKKTILSRKKDDD